MVGGTPTCRAAAAAWCVNAAPTSNHTHRPNIVVARPVLCPVLQCAAICWCRCFCCNVPPACGSGRAPPGAASAKGRTQQSKLTTHICSSTERLACSAYCAARLLCFQHHACRSRCKLDKEPCPNRPTPTFALPTHRGERVNQQLPIKQRLLRGRHRRRLAPKMWLPKHRPRMLPLLLRRLPLLLALLVCRRRQRWVVVSLPGR